jgi:hypothetical protein
MLYKRKVGKMANIMGPRGMTSGSSLYACSKNIFKKFKELNYRFRKCYWA